METKQAATPSVIDINAGGGVRRNTFNACYCHVFVKLISVKLHSAHVFVGVGYLLVGHGVRPFLLISYFTLSAHS